MKILIAGGAGFLGSHITKHFLKKYLTYQVVVLDNLSGGSLERLKEVRGRQNFEFVKLDIKNKARLGKVFQQQKPQVVINAVLDDVPATMINSMVEGNRALLELGKEFQVGRFVYLSSDEVYGETQTKEGQLRSSLESDALRPQTPLSAIQAGADLLTSSYHHLHKLPTTVLRVSNVFGPYQQKDRLLPLLITQAINNKTLPIYGDGKHARDFLPVVDFLHSVDLVLHKKEAVGEVLNVGSGREYQILAVVELILSMLGRPKDLITFVEDQKPHTLMRSLDCEKIKALLEWKEKTEFNLALAEIIRYYQENLV